MQYCEQALAIGQIEPWNSISNAAFLAAAWGAWWPRRGRTWRSAEIALLWLAATIGVGSFAWHATHASWAEVADVLPILAFVLTFLFVILRGTLAWGRAAAALACGGMLGAILLLGARVGTLLNGSIAYLPVWLGLAVLAVAVRGDARRWLSLATLLFTVSLTARTLDLAWCADFPRGLHWLWHLCNGGVIYCALRATLLDRN